MRIETAASSPAGLPRGVRACLKPGVNDMRVILARLPGLR